MPKKTSTRVMTLGNGDKHTHVATAGTVGTLNYYTEPDVRINYPWNVAASNAAAGARAHIALYLLGTYSLLDLLFGNISDLLDHMIGSIPASGSPDEARIISAMQTAGAPTPTIPGLHSALDAVKTAFVNSVQPVGGAFPKTYAEYGRRPEIEWEIANSLIPIGPTLTALSAFMAVPLLDIHEDATDLHLNHYEHIMRSFGANRSVKDLFTKSHHEFMGTHHGATELHIWRHSRDVGLLWCNERITRSKHRDTPGFVNTRTPNEKRCDVQTHKCVPGGSNDYCQEVDGVCNAMGT